MGTAMGDRRTPQPLVPVPKCCKIGCRPVLIIPGAYNHFMERLNKVLAHAGVGSRRHCDALIVTGRVSVDGRVIRELGTRADPETQKISVDGQAIREERHVYWLVNKPRGYLSTNRDP